MEEIMKTLAVETMETHLEGVMETQPVIHNTFVVERSYPAPLEKVFAAFADPAKKQRWYAPDGETNMVDKFELDFRVGGEEFYSMHFKEGHPLTGHTLSNKNCYSEIVPNRRVIFSSTMKVSEKTISVSLGTIELLPAKQGTTLVLTFQSAFLEGADGPAMREAGWRSLLDKLGAELAAN
jgi:uncharacterized protein YndB with AHSA1/START domain